MRRPFLRVASLSSRLTASSSLPLFLPIANSMEAFVSTGRSLRRGGRSSLASSSQQTKRQKTKPHEAPAEPLTYHEVESSPDPEPPPRQASAQTRIEVGKKGRAMRAMRKTLSNISSSTIDCNSTPCQALQYIKYHLVEPVRSFKWLIGWLQRSNL